MKRYVWGFDGQHENIVMVEKRRGPSAVIGRINGVGGKIEDDEDGDEAMAREFEEEIGITVPTVDWKHRVTLQHETKIWEVEFYWADISEKTFNSIVARLKTNPTNDVDESIVRLSINDIWAEEVVPNLRWIIPMCMDTGLMSPAMIIDCSE